MDERQTDRAHATPQPGWAGWVRAWAKTTGPPKVLAVCAGTPTLIVLVWGIYALFMLARELGPGAARDPSFLLPANPAMVIVGLMVWVIRAKRLATAWSLAAVLFLLGYPANSGLLELILDAAGAIADQH